MPSGELSSELFNTWLERVTEICSDSGHLEVAIIKLGDVLIHAPQTRVDYGSIILSLEHLMPEMLMRLVVAIVQAFSTHEEYIP
tara:strand:+ start:1442 stop:1693 length:252 start_codon:yes stop_codon:yes gene_type:complete